MKSWIDLIVNILKHIGSVVIALPILAIGLALYLPAIAVIGWIIYHPFVGFFKGLGTSYDILLDNDMLWGVPNIIWLILSVIYIWFASKYAERF